MLEKIKNISRKCWVVLLVFFVVGYHISYGTGEAIYPEIISLLLGCFACKINFKNLLKISVFSLIISVGLFISGWFLSGWDPVIA